MYRLNRSKDIQRDEENPFDGESSPGNFFSRAFTKISHLSGTSTYFQSDLPIQTVKTMDPEVRHISLGLDKKHKFGPRSLLNKRGGCSLCPVIVVVLVLTNIATLVALFIDLKGLRDEAEDRAAVENVGFCGTAEEDQEIRDFIASLFTDVESFGARLTIEEVDLSCMPSDSFASLSETQLDSFDNINTIDIERNCLESISPDAFRVGNFNAELTELTISDNCLENLPSGLFSRFTRTNNLRVSNNNLKELEDDIFETLEVVDILSFNGNRFKSVPEAFKSLNPMTFNIGAYRGLFEISEGYFENFDALEILNVRNSFLVRRDAQNGQDNNDANDQDVDDAAVEKFREFVSLRAEVVLSSTVVDP